MSSKLTPSTFFLFYTLDCPGGCPASCIVMFHVTFELSGKVKACFVLIRRYMPVSPAMCHVGATRDHFTSARKITFLPTWCHALPFKMHAGFSKHLPSGPMLSISWNVRLRVRVFVCPSVCSLLRYHLNVFLPPLPKVGCPIFLEIQKPWGKVMKRSGLRFEHFCLEVV